MLTPQVCSQPADTWRKAIGVAGVMSALGATALAVGASGLVSSSVQPATKSEALTRVREARRLIRPPCKASPCARTMDGAAGLWVSGSDSGSEWPLLARCMRVIRACIAHRALGRASARRRAARCRAGKSRSRALHDSGSGQRSKDIFTAPGFPHKGCPRARRAIDVQDPRQPLHDLGSRRLLAGLVLRDGLPADAEDLTQDTLVRMSSLSRDNGKIVCVPTNRMSGSW